tara:strand:- start:2153 stop:2422 length:270 start_codon:yes stop_codon:yes gene_type:complete
MTISRKQLNKIVLEEKKKLLESLELKLKTPAEVANKTVEVDADSFAKQIEKCIKGYKACELKEAKLKEQLEAIQEVKKRLKNKIISSIK